MACVITISREFGSRGHSIGQRVAKELGIAFYDEELVKKVAKESGFDEENVEDLGENANWFTAMFGSLSVRTSGNYIDPQDVIFDSQKKIILEVASQGPCVIVGRCADQILKKTDIETLDVFIFASLKFRKECILERYGRSEIPIEKRVLQKDKMRRTYYKYYTDQEWGKMTNYNMSLDSGRLGEDLCVKFIVEAAKKKVQENA